MLELNLVIVCTLIGILIGCNTTTKVRSSDSTSNSKANEISSNDNKVRYTGYYRKIALVIGNSGYQHSPLLNPKNDAQLIAETLENYGFELIDGHSLVDLKEQDMDDAIRKFGLKVRESRENTVSLFYFAGHGSEINGTNYLWPIDANPDSLLSYNDADRQGISAQTVLRELGGTSNNVKSGLNIVILDACRTNPFRLFGRTRSDQGGLAFMNAPSGTLIAYSAAPNSVAQDGPKGGNSPYSEALNSAINDFSNRTLDETFNAVGIQVKRKTENKQEPWITKSTMEGNFCFSCAIPANPPPKPEPPNLNLPPPSLPDSKRFYVYKDDDYKGNHGVWSNFMPQQSAEESNIEVTTGHANGLTGTSVAVSFRFTERSKWSGVVVASSDGYWGKTPGDGFDISGAKYLVFQAKGDRGGESIQVKAAINRLQTYGDSAQRQIYSKPLTLSNEWNEYRIPIESDINMSRIISPFVVVSEKQYNNSDQIKFYLDEIYYEK